MLDQFARAVAARPRLAARSYAASALNDSFDVEPRLVATAKLLIKDLFSPVSSSHSENMSLTGESRAVWQELLFASNPASLLAGMKPLILAVSVH